MIPSLVVTEIRSALVEYLANTFALADDEVRRELSEFLENQDEGIFRGPYLKVRTPFQPVPAGWESPLEWSPAGFVAYEHQAEAFARLSTAGANTPSPTIVTTGTGSGKTECFLYPMLDHCARMRAQEKPGIKALILYPMNALASDQAGRIAETIATEADLAGITAGLYVGEQGRHNTMGPDHLIDNREVLRADPPDILLTNYKMLDFLLLREADRDLWATNTPETLQYVVLDEFHTYDGAQGTDVAMLLRRLGATLGMASDQGPLGRAVPVATSATLGSSDSALADLRRFAGKVFGVEFDEQSIIGETRQRIQEACHDIDFLLPIPDAIDAAEPSDHHEVVARFCSHPTRPLPTTPVELGDVLLRHPLTRAVLSAVGERSRSWPDAVAEVVAFAPNWGRSLLTGESEAVEQALGQFLRLLSVAKREVNGRERPLFSIEVQLWVREVSRLLRAVSVEPRFRWRDSAAVDDEPSDDHRAELPAVYCRHCGCSGWMATVSESTSTFGDNPATIYQAAMNQSPQVRALMQAHPDDPACTWYLPEARTEAEANAEGAVPVHITPGELEARANRCPACGERRSIRFLGLAVASLASVSINTLFASSEIEDHERKLLAFTDSVQDASHRASFFGGRTHRINLRSLMARIIGDHGEVSLAELGDRLLEEAGSPAECFGLVPPDLVRDQLVRTAWTDAPKPGARERLASRLGFEADLEFGLSSRVGRTLELARVAAAEVRVAGFAALAGVVGEEIERVTGVRPVPEQVSVYLRGLVERIRLKGGLFHELLDPFVASGGKQWFLWGGRPDGLPPFTLDHGRPSFLTTAKGGDFDSVTGPAGPNPTWLVDWATRSLGVEPKAGPGITGFTLALLAKESTTIVAMKARQAKGATVYGLDRASVAVVEVGDGEGGLPVTSHVRCAICGHVHAAPPSSLDEWVGAPCLRYRCVGRFEASPAIDAQYYRRLYRSGATRRVVTGEHTGLLRRNAREDLEQAFKEGTDPDAPNVLTATPTLEMGIDIGDLSAVMLTSVPRNPASYIQRVGRAGRASGNALITTFVTTDTHGLYYLAEPEAMLAGEVRPPNCYLDAVETLKRQYLAYLFDRVADHTIDGPSLPHQVGPLVAAGLDRGSFLSAVIEASTGEAGHVDRFLDLFGSHLTVETGDLLRAFAATNIVGEVGTALATWEHHRDELGKRRDRITRAIDNLDEKSQLTHDDQVTRAGLCGQRAALTSLLSKHRNEYTISALERLGLLPNYTLLDDTVTLSATMWRKDGDGDRYETDLLEYRRPARHAIRELAPGNTFYADGHRHIIDALEIGSFDEPLYETWRLCPDCGFGALEPEGDPPARCARCQSVAIADTGARHQMLRFRTALASGSEENARVFDESDNRERERYVTMTAVDVEPSRVEQAWTLADRAFGAEFAGRTHMRTLNLGLADRPGEEIMIAGDDRHVSRFTVCAHCGAVREARRRHADSRPERLHQGWCKVRSGSRKEQWDPIVLFHELTTEAIRLLLPVSMFEIEERLASFTGLLLLGLRADFGGNPDHLEVVRSDAPNLGGQGRRRFLVLFDNVPGGTGYLARMAEPDRLRSILEAGRNAIAHCACAAEGRPACHRCLLGVTDRHHYDLVRRDLALSLVDDLLGHWQPEAVPTVGNIEIGKVEESELERRFKVALRDWAASHPDSSVSWQPVAGKGGYAAFELRLERDGVTTRYRIDEQEGLSTTPSTIPDYLIRRMDEKGPEVAVYLDGYQFHASPDFNNIAEDARKRRGARNEHRLVWNLVWDDVDSFHQAAAAEPPRRPFGNKLVSGAVRTAAQKAQHLSGGGIEVDALNQNALTLLLDYLSRPDLDEWRTLVGSAVAGLAAGAGAPVAVGRGDLPQVVRQALGADFIAVDHANGDAAVSAWRFVTDNELPVSLLLDVRDGRANEGRWTVISALDDSLAGDDAIHRRRWRDWLHWSNLLQFLTGPGCLAVMSATSEASTFPLDDVWLAELSRDPAAEPAPEPNGGRPEIDPAMLEELELIEGAEVAELVRSALLQGAPCFEAGAEVSGEPLEAAWPARKVAVLRTDQEGFEVSGWDARPATDWNVDELIAALGGTD